MQKVINAFDTSLERIMEGFLLLLLIKLERQTPDSKLQTPEAKRTWQFRPSALHWEHGH